jgi:pyridoxal phosphate enzyme (YggS family)
LSVNRNQNQEAVLDRSQTVSGYEHVTAMIADAAKKAQRDPSEVQLVAVSKTHNGDVIGPVLEVGHRVFGENRVQEAQEKWPALRKDFPDLQLHLIGPLQSNKAEAAVALFDVIESIDREKIAKTLANEMTKQGRTLPVYVQVNTGLEPQKAGIAPDDTVAFVRNCREALGLDVIGLMCIPPIDENPGPHFALLKKLAGEAGLSALSMGMSGDYETAIGFGAGRPFSARGGASGHFLAQWQNPHAGGRAGS